MATGGHDFVYMKSRILALFMLLLSITSYAQVTTYFYGRNKVQSKNETAALYSVAIYDNQTWVTVELIPTKNRSRMNYWSSSNTYIIVGNGMELPIIGFLDNNNEIDTAPFSGNWGWSNVKKDQKYYYTMVFAGKIPPGVTNFTLKDKGTYGGAHGYGFSNYTLNNPRTGATSWSEYSVKQNADSNNDGLCGIYEGSDNTGYKLGCVKQNGEYLLVYLGSREQMAWWQIGDTKARLRPSATNGFFKADWYMANKTLESNSYVVFDGGSMKTVIGSEETFYLKMYPTASSSGGVVTGTEKWSGTGFALNNGYIATNYHVVENAKSIKVQGIRGSFNTEYNATVISTDKFNDLAIIKINDSRFNGFGTIPYRVKTSTSEVGEDVFVLGYPLTTTMGDEIKLTTGVISSKTGFQGDVSLYQISAPIQPGNSGGPLFDGNGNLIGIVNAKHQGAENVGYAIKTSYLRNLMESATSQNFLPTNNSISGQALTGKVKSIKNFVFMIKCSNREHSSQDYRRPYNANSSKWEYRTTNENRKCKIVKVETTSIETKVYFEYEFEGINGEWCSISRDTYIEANGTTLKLKSAQGISYSPEYTYYNGNRTIWFTLTFPALPKNSTIFNLIEPGGSSWKFYDVKSK